MYTPHIEYDSGKFRTLVKRISERSEFVGYGVKVLNEAISFDIETSSFYHNDKKYATMYVWALDIVDITIIGRSWAEFVDLISILSDELKLNSKRLVRIYVHNLQYEFQFMRKWFYWNKVFAHKARTLIYAITSNFVEFRCSYMLYGAKLSTLGEELSELRAKNNPISERPETLVKLNYNYSLLRTSITTLSKDEIEYLIHDVKIVSEYIRNCIRQEGDITEIPLTKTGYVRRLCRQNCMSDSNYRELIKNLNLTYNEYNTAKKAFAGGYVHSNPFRTNKKFENVASYDFSSSYPAVMLSEPYPMSSGKLLENLSEKEFNRYMEEELCTLEIELTDITPTFLSDFYISISKCRVAEASKKTKLIVSNGRIYSAGRIKLFITSIDYRIISYCYKFKIKSVSNMYYYQKHYLPKKFIETILDLYQKKTLLKGVPGKEELYMLSKQMLNSMYGMCVTDILRNEYIYDSERSEWDTVIVDKLPVDKKEMLISKENNKKSRFLFYLWGCFVTAYARRNLWLGIVEMGSDYIYSDTDSLKIINAEKHEDFIKEYNEHITNKIDTVLNYYGIDVSLSRPKNKQMGIWDYEGTYLLFKTLGAKRYIYFDKRGTLHTTISGLSKSEGQKYIIDLWFSCLDTHKLNCPNFDSLKSLMDFTIDFFKHEMYIPEGHTGKMTHSYCDDEFTLTIPDYQGNISTIYEKSYIHLEDAEYNMTLAEDFRTFLNTFTLEQV